MLFSLTSAGLFVKSKFNNFQITGWIINSIFSLVFLSFGDAGTQENTIAVFLWDITYNQANIMNSVFCLETREKIGQDMGFGEARQGGVLQGGFCQHSNFFQSSLQSPSEKKDIYEPLY